VRHRSNADRLPERFDEVLAAVMEFADPILPGTRDATVWDQSGQPMKSTDWPRPARVPVQRRNAIPCGIIGRPG
jgi:hypothetical protein